MSSKIKLGKKGESLAVRYLQKKGYQVQEQNWRFHPAELDIICLHPEVGMVFVEVKTRTDQGFDINNWGLSPYKMRTLTDAAYAYMDDKNWEGEFRFDVITIAIFGDSKHEIKHYENAFFPGFEGFA